MSVQGFIMSLMHGARGKEAAKALILPSIFGHASGAGETSVLVSIAGKLPLLLKNAVRKGIASLTQYGVVSQDGTPTPTAPVDIVCNNGVLKYGKPLTLDPTRYYAYIGTSDTWLYSSDSYSIAIPVTVGKKYKITADPTTPIDGSVVNVILRWGFVDTVYDNWKQTAVYPSSTSVPIYDWIRSTPQDTQSVEVTATHPFMVIQMGATAFASNLANGRIGVAVQEVYPDGTPEVLSVGGANLFNPATVPDEFAYVNKATGKILKHADFRHSDFIAITGNVDYYFGVVGYSASTAGLAWYSDATDDTYISGVSGTTLTNEGKVATAPATAKYVRFSWQIDEAHNADWEQSVYLCINGTLDAWESYRTPQTATVENLFAVGDHKDEQDIISGAITRRVGIKVLTGEEKITYTATSSGLSRFRFTPDDMVDESGYNHILCSHYEDYALNRDGAAYRYGANILFCDDRYTNAADFKAWLADQYAAGTPVIVLYPLASETTEQVGPQSLATEKGDNVLSAISYAVPEADVEYYATESVAMLGAGNLLGVTETDGTDVTEGQEE